MVGLNTLHYDWPMGFARFDVSAMNATPARYELDDELVEAGAHLGHPVTQVLAHYDSRRHDRTADCVLWTAGAPRKAP